MKRSFFFFLFSFFFFKSSLSQDYLGFANSAFAGVNGIDVNPASIVNNPRRWDVTIIGINVAAGNNYIGMKKSALKKNGSLLKPDENTFPAFNDDDFQTNYLKERTNIKTASVFAAVNISLPSFMFTRPKHKDAFAFTCKSRVYANVDGIDPTLATMLYHNTGSPTADSLMYNQNFSALKVSLQTMVWNEYGITYGRTIQETSNERLNVAARAKLLHGLYAMYLFIDNVDYKFYKDDSLLIVSSLVHYGHSTNLEFNPSAIGFGFGGKPSVGLDLGATYEFYPLTDIRSKGKSSSKTTPLQHEYKYKIGFSVQDLGWIKFLKPSNARDFKADLMGDLDLNSLQGTGDSPLEGADDTLNVKYQMIPDDDKFRMNLPTVASLQGDYYAGKNVYVNSTINYAFQFKNNEDKIHEVTTFSLTPRWDWKWVGAYLPLSYNKFSKFRLGFTARIGPIILGMADILPFISKRDIYAADFHFMLKVPHISFKKKNKNPRSRSKFEVSKEKKTEKTKEKKRKSPKAEKRKKKEKGFKAAPQEKKTRKHIFPKVNIFKKKKKRNTELEQRDKIIYFKL